MTSPRAPSKRIIKKKEKGIVIAEPRAQKKQKVASSSSKGKGKQVAPGSPEQPRPQATGNPSLFHNQGDWMDFKTFMASKELISPRYVKMSWLESIHTYVAASIKSQGIEKLLDFGETVYPQLVRAFYSALRQDPHTGELSANLKGKSFRLSNDMWEELFGISNSGNVASKSALAQSEVAFNKADVYRSMLKNPAEPFKNKLTARPLTLEWRLIHYLFTWVILPRGSNHAQVFDEDLILMWFIQRNLKVNWVYHIQDNMLKARRQTESMLPYGAMITKIIEYFQISTAEEPIDLVKLDNEIRDKHIKQMGYMKMEGSWVEKNLRDAVTEAVEDSDQEQQQPQASQSEKLLQQILDNLVILNQAQARIEASHQQIHADHHELKECFYPLSDRLDTLGVSHNDDLPDSSDNSGSQSKDF